MADLAAGGLKLLVVSLRMRAPLFLHPACLRCRGPKDTQLIACGDYPEG